MSSLFFKEISVLLTNSPFEYFITPALPISAFGLVTTGALSVAKDLTSRVNGALGRTLPMNPLIIIMFLIINPLLNFLRFFIIITTAINRLSILPAGQRGSPKEIDLSCKCNKLRKVVNINPQSRYSDSSRFAFYLLCWLPVQLALLTI